MKIVAHCSSPIFAFACVLFAAFGCVDEQEALKLYATAAETDSAAAELADGKALEDAVESGADAASDLASDLDAAAGDAKAEILAETDADVSVDAPAQTDVAEVVADSDAAEADAIGGADENGGADSAVDIAAACTPGGCDDGNPCTDDKCDPVVGCKNTPNSAACDDGDGCTVGDVCLGGKCVVGKGKLFGKTFGGAGAEVAHAVATMTDGGFVLAGSSDSTDLPNGEKNAGSLDFWVARTDFAGKLVWSKTYGGQGGEQVEGLVVLPDGGFAVAGNTNSPDLPGSPKYSGGGSDFWLLRTDASGNLLWSKTFGGAGYDAPNAIVSRKGGGFAAVGGSESSDLPDAQKTSGGRDFWLVATDAGGVPLWNKTYGGSGDDEALAIAELSDGGFALAGKTQSTDLPGGQKSLGQDDMWLVRTDANGNLLWNKAYGGSNYDSAQSVVWLPDGGFALAGFTMSIDLPAGNKTKGLPDVWLVRTDLVGNILWNKTFGGKLDDYAWAIAVVPTGGLVLACRTQSTDLPGGQKSAGQTDFWLLRTDESGNLLWNQTYGGEQHDFARSIALLADGGFAFAGQTASTDLPEGQKNAGLTDFYLIRTDAFGHTNCADAGICAAKKATDCDDKNPCTADLCDGKLGCSNAKLADGSACGSAGTCAAGVCKPNAVGCINDGDSCGNGKGKCSNSHCFSTDDKGYNWTLVPAGTFWMGCNSAVDKDCQSNEKPQHLVDMSAYWIGVYEVTVANYKACADQNPLGCTKPAGNGGFQIWDLPAKGQLPVNYVNWSQSQSYCKWLGGDLPTEAQWEKAAKGGCENLAGQDCAKSAPKYPWGNMVPVCGKHAVFDNGLSQTCGGTFTSYDVGVGSPQGQSPYGAYDMAGNAWEWNLDSYDANFYGSLLATQKDAVNADVSDGRVLRGGGFDADAGYLRASFRKSVPKSYAYFSIGIRCAKPLL